MSEMDSLWREEIETVGWQVGYKIKINNITVIRGCKSFCHLTAAVLCDDVARHGEPSLEDLLQKIV